MSADYSTIHFDSPIRDFLSRKEPPETVIVQHWRMVLNPFKKALHSRCERQNRLGRITIPAKLFRSLHDCTKALPKDFSSMHDDFIDGPLAF